MRGIMRIFGLVAVMVTAFACTNGTRPSPAMSSGDKPTNGAIVKIDNFSFGPANVTIPIGTTVTWTNNDDIPHTVRAVDGSFHSKAMDTADSYSFTFAKPGVYSYFCSVHPKMVGKVVVK